MYVWALGQCLYAGATYVRTIDMPTEYKRTYQWHVKMLGSRIHLDIKVVTLYSLTLAVQSIRKRR